MTIHHVTVDGGELQVLFLHGLFGQGKNFHGIAKAIVDLATSHLVDLPNHGRSGWTTEFDYDDMQETVAEWIRERFDEPVVVGHSMGGKTAMRLALRHPELVRGLVVVDISPARNDAGLEFVSLVAGLKSLRLDEVESRRDADAKLAERIPNRTVRQFLLQNLQRSGDAWSWGPNLDLLGDNLDLIQGWPSIDAEYDGPTLWMLGGKSDYFRPEHAPIMQRLFPKVRTITLKRAGHWVHSEDPESFIATLRKFLTGLDSAESD